MRPAELDVKINITKTISPTNANDKALKSDENTEKNFKKSNRITSKKMQKQRAKILHEVKFQNIKTKLESNLDTPENYDVTDNNIKSLVNKYTENKFILPDSDLHNVKTKYTQNILFIFF